MNIYNTLNKKKEKFYTIEKKKVKMYVCGITAYDHCHIGHARSFFAFDTIVRYLKYKKYEVIFVRNITDIDDKIIEKSHISNMSTTDISEKYINSMQKDMYNLRIIKPTHEPKATDYIDDMIVFIKKLMEKKIAYRSENGDIYYDTSKFEKYGELSCNKVSDLKNIKKI